MTPASVPEYYQLVILETSDIHCNIVPYDYYNDTKSELYGFAKISTLIKKFRALYKNNILVDNGDLLQGNAFADFVTRVQPSPKNKTHPIYKIMNYLKFDLATVGNHDFNYGLPYLQNVTKKAHFPYICSNVFFFDKDLPNNRGKRIFLENFIIKKKLNKNEFIKVGFFGVVPPQILVWDKHILQNKVVAQDIIESANEQVKKLKQNGADIIIVLAHSGILPIKYIKGSENACYELTKINGIDAVLSGHAHNIFPGGKVFDNLEQHNIENKIGKINGIPIVMPGAWEVTLE